MPSTSQYHRPLVGGIKITSGVGRNPISLVGDGTLTGLATKSNGRKVLMTCMHVMARNAPVGPQGEEMYQDVLDQPPPHAMPEPASNRVGVNLTGPALGGALNSVDAAMCELATDAQGNPVPAEFLVHSSPAKKILHGTMTAQKGDILSFHGQHGEAEVTVLAIRDDVRYTIQVPDPSPDAEEPTRGSQRQVGPVLVLDMGGRTPKAGDSGAPCLIQVGDAYKMAAIFVSGETVGPVDVNPDTGEIASSQPPDSIQSQDSGETQGANTINTNVGYAFPASAAQTALGITFGKTPPSADAGRSRIVEGGDEVCLDGRSSSDVDGQPLTAQWEQTYPATPQIDLTTPTSLEASFVAPMYRRDTVLRFTLTVTDIFGQTDDDHVWIVVRATPETPAPTEAPTQAPTEAPTQAPTTRPTQAPPTQAPPTQAPPTQAPPTTRPPTTRPPTTRPPTTRPPTTRPPTTRPPTARPPTTAPPPDDIVGPPDDFTTAPPPTTRPPTTRPPTTAPPPDDIVGPPDDFTTAPPPTTAPPTTAPPTTAPPTTRPPTQAPETWGPWTATGRERWNGLETEYEEERTSSRGRTQTRWVPG